MKKNFACERKREREKGNDFGKEMMMMMIFTKGGGGGEGGLNC